MYPFDVEAVNYSKILARELGSTESANTVELNPAGHAYMEQLIIQMDEDLLAKFIRCAETGVEWTEDAANKNLFKIWMSSVSKLTGGDNMPEVERPENAEFEYDEENHFDLQNIELQFIDDMNADGIFIQDIEMICAEQNGTAGDGTASTVVGERISPTPFDVEEIVPSASNVTKEHLPSTSSVVQETVPFTSFVAEELVPSTSSVPKEPIPSTLSVFEETVPSESSFADETVPSAPPVVEETNPSKLSVVEEPFVPALAANEVTTSTTSSLAVPTVSKIETPSTNAITKWNPTSQVRRFNSLVDEFLLLILECLTCIFQNCLEVLRNLNEVEDVSIKRKKPRVKKASVMSSAETIRERLEKLSEKKRLEDEKLERKRKEERERVVAEKKRKKEAMDGWIVDRSPSSSEKHWSSATELTPQKPKTKIRRLLFSDSDD